MAEPKYNVFVWGYEYMEQDKGNWEYPKGLSHRPWNITIKGVRKVLRELETMGYQARKDDPSVLVERKHLESDSETLGAPMNFGNDERG